MTVLSRELTGRYRYRVETVGWLHKRQIVVLQLEVKVTWDASDPDDWYRQVKSETYWRDAKPEEMMVDTFHEPELQD